MCAEICVASNMFTSGIMRYGVWSVWPLCLRTAKLTRGRERERGRDVEKQIFAFVVFADREHTSTQIFLIQPLIYEMERKCACVCASSYSSKFAAFVAVSVLLCPQNRRSKAFQFANRPLRKFGASGSKLCDNSPNRM